MRYIALRQVSNSYETEGDTHQVHWRLRHLWRFGWSAAHRASCGALTIPGLGDRLGRFREIHRSCRGTLYLLWTVSQHVMGRITNDTYCRCIFSEKPIAAHSSLLSNLPDGSFHIKVQVWFVCESLFSGWFGSLYPLLFACLCLCLCFRFRFHRH